MATIDYTTDVNGIKTATYSTSTANTALNGGNVGTVPSDVIHVVIQGFTSIGNDTFKGKLTNAQSITIGDTVESIGNYAFYQARKVETLNLGSGLLTIGIQAFLELNALKNLSIPDSVTSIGDYAFVAAISLESLTLGSGLTTIPIQLFYNAISLESLTIPDSVTTIGDQAFYNTHALTSLTIGSGVTSIGIQAFANMSSLTSLTIPDSVTSIGDKAFYFPNSLTSLTIGSGVTTIGDQAFYNIQNLIEAYAIKNATIYKLLGTSDIVTNYGAENTTDSLNAITTLMSAFINDASPSSSEWLIIAFPTITSTTIADDHSTITVTFSEDVYNTPSGTGDLEADDFTLSISGSGATLVSATPSSISKNSSTTYTLGFTLSGALVYDEVITVVPSSSASIFDIDGAAASTTQSNNTILIPDFPTIASTTIADDYSTITVTFSKDVYNTSSGSGDLEADDFTLSISGDATLVSSTPSSISKISSTTYTLGFGYSLSGTVNAVITVVPSSSTSIFDLEGDAASTTQSNNTAELTFYPTIASTTIAGDYSTITVTFSEDVYNTSSGTGDLEADDFTLSISGDATLVSATPSSISKISSTTYTLGFGYSLSGTANAVITVVPSSSTSIFDLEGDAASTTQSNNTAELTFYPTIASTTIAGDYSTITVTFSEDVYNTSSGTGDLEADDFTLSISGDATLVSATPSSISKISSTTYTLGFGYSLSGTNNAIITVVPSSSTSIFDLEGDAASTTQSNNTAELTFYPTIASTTVSEDNTTITVTFSDDVYNTSSGTGDLEADDFTLSISGGATLGSTTPSSILKINTTTYTLGFALSGIAYDEVITVVPSSSTSIFDIEGDAASTTQSNNTVNIRELFNINLTVLDSNISIGEVATFNKFIASSYTPNATLYFASPLSLWTHYLRFHSDGDADITDEGVTLFSLQALNLIGTSLATTTSSATSGLYTPVSNTESVYTLNRISDISEASGTTEDPKSLLYFMSKLAKAIFGAEQTIDMIDNSSEMEIAYATSIDGCAETISNYFATDSIKTIYDSIGSDSHMKLKVAKEIYDYFSATVRLTMGYDARISTGVPNDTIGCLITSNTGSGSSATVDVLMNVLNGSIDNITINTSGTGYMKGDSITITTGNSATIDILELTDVQSHMLNGTLNDVDGITFPFHLGDKLHVKIELSNNANQENVAGKNLDTIGNTITSVIDLIIKLV